MRWITRLFDRLISSLLRPFYIHKVLLRKRLRDFRRDAFWQIFLGVEQNYQFHSLHYLRREIGKHLAAEASFSYNERYIVSFHSARRVVARMTRYVSSGQVYIRVEMSVELLDLQAHFQGAFPESYMFFRPLPLEVAREA